MPGWSSDWAGIASWAVNELRSVGGGKRTVPCVLLTVPTDCQWLPAASLEVCHLSMLAELLWFPWILITLTASASVSSLTSPNENSSRVGVLVFWCQIKVGLSPSTPRQTGADCVLGLCCFPFEIGSFLRTENKHPRLWLHFSWNCFTLEEEEKKKTLI